MDDRERGSVSAEGGKEQNYKEGGIERAKRERKVVEF